MLLLIIISDQHLGAPVGKGDLASSHKHSKQIDHGPGRSQRCQNNKLKQQM